MIPKIIHLCWLSGDPYPSDIQKCLDSWKVYLPDYEVWLWDTKRFDVNSTLWTKQTFEAKKYAFAADYIRLYALYHFGGIYLDSDVLVYKSFNNLLHLPYFMGQDYAGCMEAAVIGAEKGLPWIGEILNRYKDRPFIMNNNEYDVTPLPQVFFHQLVGKYTFKRINQIEDYKWDEKTIWLFDRDFFNSRNSIESRKTIKSYCTHNYAGSWTKRNDYKSRLKSVLPTWAVRFVFYVSHHTYKKAYIHRFDPVYQQKRLKKD